MEKTASNWSKLLLPLATKILVAKSYLLPILQYPMFLCPPTKAQIDKVLKILHLFIDPPFNIRRLLSENPLTPSIPDPARLSQASRVIWSFRKMEYEEKQMIFPWMANWNLTKVILSLPPLSKEQISTLREKHDKVKIKHTKALFPPNNLPPPIAALKDPQNDRFMRTQWPDVKNFPLTPKLRSFLLRLYFNALATRKAKHLNLPCPACQQPTSTTHVLLDCPNLPPVAQLQQLAPLLPNIPKKTAEWIQRWSCWCCRWTTHNKILFDHLSIPQSTALASKFITTQTLIMKAALTNRS